MWEALTGSTSLIDASGYIIITTILVFLVLGVALTAFLRGQYGEIARDLSQNASFTPSFNTPVLNQIFTEALEAAKRHSGEINTQAIIDHRFQVELRTLLMAERFVKASTGLMIILGLVGTFYGLTLSIGKLVTLVSGDVTGAAELTQSLTLGLTEALSGMSVAFSTSLFGIVAAIVMTLLGVVANVTDKRNALMVQIESYLDNVLLSGPQDAAGEGPLVIGSTRGFDPRTPEGLQQLIVGFGQSVARLEGAVSHFEHSLEAFAGSTREFHEFNLHLKDNIQRMSLSFADLSNTLKANTNEMRRR